MNCKQCEKKIKGKRRGTEFCTHECYRQWFYRKNAERIKKYNRERHKVYGKLPEVIRMKAEYLAKYRQRPEYRFRSMQINARKYGVICSLTLEDCHKLWVKPCVYCGGSALNTWGGYGIDRKDNSRGYEKGNCVSCCSICNFAKHGLKHKDFMAWISRLVKYQSK